MLYAGFKLARSTYKQYTFSVINIFYAHALSPLLLLICKKEITILFYIGKY